MPDPTLRAISPDRATTGSNGQVYAGIRLVSTPLSRSLKARRAGLARHRGSADPETLAAAAAYRAEIVRAHIRLVLDTPPSLTAQQRADLANLLLAESA